MSSINIALRILRPEGNRCFAQRRREVPAKSSRCYLRRISAPSLLLWLSYEEIEAVLFNHQLPYSCTSACVYETRSRTVRIDYFDNSEGEGMNFVDNEPRWQTLSGTRCGTLPEPSLMGPALEYTLGRVSQSQQVPAGYKLEAYDALSPDCTLTPVSLEGELDVSFAESTPLQWQTSFSQDFDLPSISPEPNPQDAAKGMRKEVCLATVT